MTTARTAHRRHRARRLLHLIAALATTVALAAGCSSGSAASGGSAGDGQPRQGGEITFLIDSLGPTWIPNNSAISSFQGHIWGHVTDKLVYVDDNGKASPWIAESWEQNDRRPSSPCT